MIAHCYDLGNQSCLSTLIIIPPFLDILGRVRASSQAQHHVLIPTPYIHDTQLASGPSSIHSSAMSGSEDYPESVLELVLTGLHQALGIGGQPVRFLCKGDRIYNNSKI